MSRRRGAALLVAGIVVGLVGGWLLFSRDGSPDEGSRPRALRVRGWPDSPLSPLASIGPTPRHASTPDDDEGETSGPWGEGLTEEGTGAGTEGSGESGVPAGVLDGGLDEVALAAGIGGPVPLVVCAPSETGDDAHSRRVERPGAMAALAEEIARQAGWAPGALSGSFVSGRQRCFETISALDAGVAVLPLPLHLEFQSVLDLREKAAAAIKGVEKEEAWSLLARRGAVRGPASLDGWNLASLVSYSPGFVRGPVLGTWGTLPAGVRLAQTGQVAEQVLDARAGDAVALLVEGSDTAFALTASGELEIVFTSPPMPWGVVVDVRNRLPGTFWQKLVPVLARLGSTREGRGALEGVRRLRFFGLDARRITEVQAAYRGAR